MIPASEQAFILFCIGLVAFLGAVAVWNFGKRLGWW